MYDVYINISWKVWFQDLPFRGGVYRCQLPEHEKFNLEVRCNYCVGLTQH